MPGRRPSLRKIRSSFASCAASRSVRIVPVAAAVDEPLAEHRLEKIVAEIVVVLADHIRARAALQIEKTRLHVQPGIVEPTDALVEPRIEQAEQKPVEIVCIPPAVHVRLAKAKRTVRKNARIQLPVVHADIAWSVAIDSHAREIEQRFDARMRTRA